MLCATASCLGKLNIKNQKVLPTVWIFWRARVMTSTTFPMSSSTGWEQGGPLECGYRTE